MGKSLNAAFVGKVKHSGSKGPDQHYDKNGLVLRVMPSGSKQWLWKGTVHGKRRSAGLGGYPLVTLSEARERAFELRRTARQGIDPLALKRKAEIPTFREAARKTVETLRPTWKSEGHAKRWIASLERYVFPRLGSVRVDAITAQDVMSVLTATWDTKTDTTRRVRQRISAVMRWAVAQGFRKDDPAGEVLRGVLKAPTKQEHFKAVEHDRVGAVIAAVRLTEAQPATKLCLEWLILTACRSREAREAAWSEIDLERRIWVIPPERTKTGKEHRVPLSGRALELLSEAREIQDRTGLVFPSINRKPLSDNALSKLLREMKAGGTPHGFRSSFRDWAAEQSVPREIAEQALGHAVAGQVEAAYFRSDLLEARREVMERWAAHVARPLAAVSSA